LNKVGKVGNESKVGQNARIFLVQMKTLQARNWRFAYSGPRIG
jgi:hypothetical protein